MPQFSTQSCPPSRPETTGSPPLPPDLALVGARRRIAQFRGRPPLRSEPLAVVQSIVVSALFAAPQPVTPRWTAYSLAVLGELVRWADRTGQPLEVEHLLSVSTRIRFLAVEKAGLTQRSRASYQSRLKLIAHAHQVVVETGGNAMPFPKLSSSAPLSPQDEADLWGWASSLRPWTRQASMQGIVALGLGVGLAQTEASRVRGCHVRTTANGATTVAVLERDGGLARTVVARRGWEVRLSGIAQAAQPDGWLVSPWRESQQSPQSLDQLRWNAQRPSGCPVAWSPMRLRTTWLARHLAAGTPLPVLLKAGGPDDSRGTHASFAAFAGDVGGGRRSRAPRGRAAVSNRRHRPDPGSRAAVAGTMLRHEPVTPSMAELLAGIERTLQNQAKTERPRVAGRALVESVSTLPDDMVRAALEAIEHTLVGAVPLPQFVQQRVDGAKKKTGRPSMIPVKALLVAMLLCGVDSREVSCAQASRLLHRRISGAARDLLGMPADAVPIPPPGPGRKIWRRTRERRAQRAFKRLRAVFDPSIYPTGRSMTWVELDGAKRNIGHEEEQELQQALDLLTTGIQTICWTYLPDENRRKYDGSACIDATPLRLYARGRSVHDEIASTDPDGGYYVRTGDHNGEKQVRKAFYWTYMSWLGPTSAEKTVSTFLAYRSP